MLMPVLIPRFKGEGLVELSQLEPHKSIFLFYYISVGGIYTQIQHRGSSHLYLKGGLWGFSPRL